MRLNEVEPTAKGRKAGEKSRKDDAWREQGPRFQRWSLSPRRDPHTHVDPTQSRNNSELCFFPEKTTIAYFLYNFHKMKKINERKDLIT